MKKRLAILIALCTAVLLSGCSGFNNFYGSRTPLDGNGKPTAEIVGANSAAVGSVEVVLPELSEQTYENTDNIKYSEEVANNKGV